ncbi:MAG: hypothetical protein RSG53_08865 [Oscillospiraceae bacterium]
MADFDFVGIDELERDFSQIAKMPASVQDEILEAEAGIIMPAQKRMALSMLTGPYNKGAIAAAVTKNRPVATSDGRKMYLTFNGSQHGNRIAEIAFVNEYGKKSQQDRPFIKTALETHADEAVEAGYGVYNKWLTKNNL